MPWSRKRLKKRERTLNEPTWSYIKPYFHSICRAFNEYIGNAVAKHIVFEDIILEVDRTLCIPQIIFKCLEFRFTVGEYLDRVRGIKLRSVSERARFICCTERDSSPCKRGSAFTRRSPRRSLRLVRLDTMRVFFDAAAKEYI